MKFGAAFALELCAAGIGRVRFGAECHFPLLSFGERNAV